MYLSTVLLWNLISLNFEVSGSVFFFLFGHVAWYEVVKINSFSLQSILCMSVYVKCVTDHKSVKGHESEY